MNRQLPKEKYLVIRLALWLISVIIALLPALYEFQGWQEMSLGENFSDLLFVVVPVSALALSTTIDYLCVGFPDLSTNEFFNSLCSLLLNSIGLISALTGFVSIENGPMTARQIYIYSALIGISVVAGLVTECVVTWNHHGFRSKSAVAGAAPAAPPSAVPTTI
jgi:hypothetical protein